MLFCYDSLFANAWRQGFQCDIFLPLSLSHPQLQLEGKKKKKKKKPVLDLTTGEIKPAGSAAAEVVPSSSQDAPPTSSVGARGGGDESTAPVGGPSTANVDGEFWLQV